MSAGFSPTISGRENVRIRGQLLGKRGKELEQYIDEVAEFAEIEEFFDSPVQFYSSGMKSRLGFAASSVLAPDILIIDEVLAVGDLPFRIRCYERINDLANRSAVIYVSHSPGQVSRLCERAIFLEKGSVLFDGEAQGAIALYQEKMNDKSEKKTKGVLNPDLIRLTIRVNEVPWQSDQAVSYGDKLGLEIDVSKIPRGSNIRVILRSPSQEVLMDWSSLRAPLQWPGTFRKLIASLGRVELCPGKYYLSVQVMSADYVNHLCISEAIPFIVDGNFYTQNPVQREPHWKFE